MLEREQNAVHLRVGDIGFALSSDDLSLKLEAQGVSRRFVTAAGEPDVRVTASWSNSDDPIPGEKLFDAGGLWNLYRHDGGYLFRFTAPCYGREPYKTARFNADFTSGELFLNGGCFPRNTPLYPLEYPLDEVLMVNLLAQGRGVEVHACGVRDAGGQGYLFLGKSGAGKSTMAQLWRNVEQAAASRDREGAVAGTTAPSRSRLATAGYHPAPQSTGVEILSDDRIVLRAVDGKIWMYGTPWHGESACPASVPVTRIFFLEHGQKNQAVSLREADVVARLMASSFVPYFSPEGLDFTLEFLQKVAQSVPCMEFSFVPEAPAVDFVRNCKGQL